MASPKRRHSKARTRTRRTAWAMRAIVEPELVECPRCHELKPTHRVCPNCGWYKGRQVIAVGEEEA